MSLRMTETEGGLSTLVFDNDSLDRIYRSRKVAIPESECSYDTFVSELWQANLQQIHSILASWLGDATDQEKLLRRARARLLSVDDIRKIWRPSEHGSVLRVSQSGLHVLEMIEAEDFLRILREHANDESLGISRSARLVLNTRRADDSRSLLITSDADISEASIFSMAGMVQETKTVDKLTKIENFCLQHPFYLSISSNHDESIMELEAYLDDITRLCHCLAVAPQAVVKEHYKQYQAISKWLQVTHSSAHSVVNPLISPTSISASRFSQTPIFNPRKRKNHEGFEDVSRLKRMKIEALQHRRTSLPLSTPSRLLSRQSYALDRQQSSDHSLAALKETTQTIDKSNHSHYATVEADDIERLHNQKWIANNALDVILDSDSAPNYFDDNSHMQFVEIPESPDAKLHDPLELTNLQSITSTIQNDRIIEVENELLSSDETHLDVRKRVETLAQDDHREPWTDDKTIQKDDASAVELAISDHLDAAREVHDLESSQSEGEGTYDGATQSGVEHHMLNSQTKRSANSNSTALTNGQQEDLINLKPPVTTNEHNNGRSSTPNVDHIILTVSKSNEPSSIKSDRKIEIETELTADRADGNDIGFKASTENLVGANPTVASQAASLVNGQSASDNDCDIDSEEENEDEDKDAGEGGVGGLIGEQASSFNSGSPSNSKPSSDREGLIAESDMQHHNTSIDHGSAQASGDSSSSDDDEELGNNEDQKMNFPKAPEFDDHVNEPETESETDSSSDDDAMVMHATPALTTRHRTGRNAPPIQKIMRSVMRSMGGNDAPESDTSSSEDSSEESDDQQDVKAASQAQQRLAMARPLLHQQPEQKQQVVDTAQHDPEEASAGAASDSGRSTVMNGFKDSGDEAENASDSNSDTSSVISTVSTSFAASTKQTKTEVASAGNDSESEVSETSSPTVSTAVLNPPPGRHVSAKVKADGRKASRKESGKRKRSA